jgi:YggT family protein
VGALIVILLQSLIVVAWLVVLGRIVLSFIDPMYQRPISRYVFSLTEPVLAPIRNVLPTSGQFDFAPLALLLGLGLLMRLVLSA